MKTTKLEANKANIDAAITSIINYANSKGYQIVGDFKKEGFLSNLFSGLKFDSKSQEKVLRNYLTRLDKKVGMALANRFLHFLYKKVYKMTEAPRVEYSEKELKIKAAQKAWKQSLETMKKLHEAYKLEKGDFYKKK